MPMLPRHAALRTAFLGLSPLLLFAAMGCQSNSGGEPRELHPRDAPATVHLGSHDADALLAATPTRAAGVWVPNAVASFLNIDRSTSYALVHDSDLAVLIIAAAEAVEDDADESRWIGSSTGTNYLWWVIELPGDASPGQTIALGGRHRAWLLERVPGLPTHGSPARGSVVVQSVSDGQLIVDLEVIAPIGRPTAGQTEPPAISTSERVSLTRRVPVTLGTPEIETESGAVPRVEPVRLPIWTALGPDEWKPAGWKYERPGRSRP